MARRGQSRCGRIINRPSISFLVFCNYRHTVRAHGKSSFRHVGEQKASKRKRIRTSQVAPLSKLPSIISPLSTIANMLAFLLAVLSLFLAQSGTTTTTFFLGRLRQVQSRNRHQIIYASPRRFPLAGHLNFPTWPLALLALGYLPAVKASPTDDILGIIRARWFCQVFTQILAAWLLIQVSQLAFVARASSFTEGMISHLVMIGITSAALAPLLPSLQKAFNAINPLK